MTDKIMLPWGYMDYLGPILRLSKEMNGKLILDQTPEGKFVVYVEHVFLDTMPHTPIQGLGTTVNGACEDFMRRARGLALRHIISDKVETFI